MHTLTLFSTRPSDNDQIQKVLSVLGEVVNQLKTRARRDLFLVIFPNPFCTDSWLGLHRQVGSVCVYARRNQKNGEHRPLTPLVATNEIAGSVVVRCCCWYCFATMFFPPSRTPHDFLLKMPFFFLLRF